MHKLFILTVTITPDAGIFTWDSWEQIQKYIEAFKNARKPLLDMSLWNEKKSIKNLIFCINLTEHLWVY